MDEVRRLWQAQLRLECKALDPTGRWMIRIDGAEPDPIVTCSVVRFSDGYAIVFADGGEVVDLEPAHVFDDPESAAATIGRGRPARAEIFSTYVFPHQVSARDPAVVRQGREQYAVIVGGREVSWASSSRSNDEAAELWVRTNEDSRGHGYATLAARAWAAEVTGEGRIAFYSHRDSNAPSRHLAARLGVVPVFDLANLTIDD